MYKLLFLFLLIPTFTWAQEKKLFVEGVSPNLYVNHKVQPKENYYSIGRIYNISPREIAPFNKLQLEGGLTLGQNLKIPIGTEFFQNGNAEVDETFVPVYHTLKDKETLYRVAHNYNGLSLETLKRWNKIKGETVKKGTTLIIGYLKVKKELSELAKNGIGTTIVSNDVAVNQVQEKNIQTEKAPDKKIEKTTTPVKTQQEPDREATNPVKKAVEPEVTITDAKKESVKKMKGGVFKMIFENQEKKANR